MTRVLYLLFFCSGFSGLIYQIVWVRVFGNVFGNTIYSTSLVVAVFMLGLGVGSYIVGAWADRRYAVQSESLLRAYGYFELVIGLMGLGISVLLPHLGQLSALVSSYSRDASGWYVLSTWSYLARAGVAVALLTPITVLMGGTLTLLIRHLVRRDFEIGGWQIAVLYAVNTAGAALGCVLTDFVLVPSSGLQRTQLIAVLFNVGAASGALWLASRPAKAGRYRETARAGPLDSASLGGSNRLRQGYGGPPKLHAKAEQQDPTYVVPLASLALAMSGFAGMGLEILWFRHFTILLGGFRAVFSLLLTVILIGIGAGSLLGGVVHRRSSRPGEWLMVVQGLFVVTVLLGLALTDARQIDDVVRADPADRAATGDAVEPLLALGSGLSRALTELWFNAKPMLLEMGIPALLMGFSFPLANALVQRAEPFVGRRAGALYLANTVGAVCGSLATGFLLLPTIGIQSSAAALALAAGLAVVPLYFVSGVNEPFVVRSERARKPNAQDTPVEPRTEPSRATPAALAGSLFMGSAALGLWWLLPSDYIIAKALALSAENQRVLTVSEGLNEVIAVTEAPDGRELLTNGHSMSSTKRLAQRYMRALAHIPLLAIDDPETVLVIGFGVGNTTHAATLHPSIRRVEVADLSREILNHASYFKDANRDVLNDGRVVVYVNDGRHHLQTQSAPSYDLITLEPPPIGYAGVGALYSKEFYQLAKARLKPKGYVSQWLPAYQAPTATTLAMIRAFVDVFPQAVLISGAAADLLLVGANDSRIGVDPARIAAVLSGAPAVHADLQRLDLGSVREIVGTFVGSAQTLAEATRETIPVTDDRPMQEYGVRSLLNFGEAVPASVVDLSRVATWCPNCFVDGNPAPLVEGLDTYLALLDLAYTALPLDVARARRSADVGPRAIAGSAYLGAIVPESADLHNILGIDLARKGNLAEAIGHFREALRRDPNSGQAHWHLGAALASHGARGEAVEHLRRSVQLDPNNDRARQDLASLLNNLGAALASQGKVDEAVDQFQQALMLKPEFAEAQRNLTIALRQRQQVVR